MPVHRPPHPLRVSFLAAALAMLAPFTLDTYLPSFPAIAADLAPAWGQLAIATSSLALWLVWNLLRARGRAG